MVQLIKQTTQKNENLKSHHSLDCSIGLSFCAIWYKALIAFMLKSGGFLSATKQVK